MRAEMKDSILIFDEAHNVLASARDENTIHFNPNLKDKAEKHIEIIRKGLFPSLRNRMTR
jgi:Rad3-related DNA helicase